MKISPNSHLLFIGDSITDCGRHPLGNPTPWDASTGLGRGYVDLVAAHFGAVCPEQNIRVSNRGCNGHTVRDLAARWDNDVLDQRPDWVSIKVGINDVWRQFDQPLVKDTHVLPDEYEATLTRLIATTLTQVKGVVLMTPFFIEPNLADPMRQRMDAYGQIVKKLARQFDLPHVDSQAAIDAVLKHMHPSTLAWDRIHPNTTGHMVLARAFLRAIEAPV